MIRQVLALAFAAVALPAEAQTKLQLQHSPNCTALAPAGWAFTGESPAGTSFGADINRADGGALASYYVVGVTPEMRTGLYAPWYATPDKAALGTLSQLGTAPITCGQPREPAGGMKMMQCRTPAYLGVAAYKSFPMANGGYVLVMRTAGATPAQWKSAGAVAEAVSRSMRCQVPIRPSSADWTSEPSGSRESGNAKKEADSEYSQWLGMESYHDASTGENYWVSPSTDWHETGPRGPGYYANVAGEPRKLAPGRVG